MKNLRKCLVFLLMFSLCFGAVSCLTGAYEAMASEVENPVDASGVFYYVVYTDNTAGITKYEGNFTELVIPEVIENADNGEKYPVVTIGKESFKGNELLTKVVIPDTVTLIEHRAFSGCINLAEVNLSKSLVKLEAEAFGGCPISSIEIPTSLEETTQSGNKGPFANCSKLVNVTFEDGVKRVAKFLFAGCTGIQKMNIPYTVATIDEGAFYNCVNLKEVYIPDSVTIIGKNAFNGCSAIEALDLSANVTAIHMGAFEKCSKLIKIVIPNSVLSIGERAFYQCTGLTEITLSNKLVTMGYWAFGECPNITAVEIPKSLESCTLSQETGPFNKCSGLKNVIFEEGVKRIAKGLFAGCTGLEKINIPFTVTTIDECAFSKCTYLSEVYMPDSVTVIGKSAFHECVSIKNIDLSDNVVSIGATAFQNCDTLEAIVIPNSVTSIGEGGFNGCGKIASLKLSNKLETMGAMAFGSCVEIKEVEIPKSLKSCTMKTMSNFHCGPFAYCSGLKDVSFEEGTSIIAECLFAGCTGIENIVIPNTTMSINHSAFYDATKLLAVSLPDGLNLIDKDAFRNCRTLEQVVIPDSVMTMGTYVFAGCSDLKSAKLPAYRDTLPEGTFMECSSLLELDIPAAVTVIDRYAAKKCISLEKLMMGNNVTVIGEHAFYECKSLKDVALSQSLNKINTHAFYDCEVLETISLPGSLTYLGNYAFATCDALTGITIPNAVSSMGQYCFYDCYSLKNLKLGTGMKDIPVGAFKLCPSLVDVIIPFRVTKIGNQAFNACVRLANVTIPQSVTTIGIEVFSYPEEMKIYGVADSYAQTYAENNGIIFEAIVVPAETVVLDRNELEIYKAAKYSLNINVEPMNFTEVIVWKTSDPSVATVDDDGTITAVAAGKATISAFVGNVVAKCEVTVLQPVTSVRLNKTSLSLEGGETFQLVATVSPEEAYNKELVWISLDPSVATVDSNGLVTAVKKGTTRISATATDGSNKMANCNITVTGNVIIVEDVAGLESEHNYVNNFSDSWLYKVPGATGLLVTFDEKTFVEDKYDYIYIYDSTGAEVGKYTGNALAGETVSITGDTVKIKLVTDKAGTDWGFKVTEVKATGMIEPGPSMEQIEAFVERMYTVALGRAFDEAGKANWVAMLTAGTHDGAGIAKEFILGAEFKARGLSDEAFLDVLYKTFYDREADASGKDYWSYVLSQGFSREYVLSNFVNLEEFTMVCDNYGIERGLMLENGTPVNPGIPQFVKRLYTNVLGRSADNEGLKTYTMALLVKAETAESVAKNFLLSAEYEMMGKNTQGFVADLYIVFMNRTGSAEDIKFWADTIDTGLGRAWAISEFAKSEEFRIIAASYGL